MATRATWQRSWGEPLVDEYWRHHRRPLRTYQRRVWRDFSVDGDVDPEELFLVDPDGFRQQVVQFTRTNEFNAVMHAAASALLTEVRDSETRQQLRRVRDALAPQMGTLRPSARAIPSRHRRWQTLYDLSAQVLSGFGVSLADADHLLAPGYASNGQGVGGRAGSGSSSGCPQRQCQGATRFRPGGARWANILNDT